MCASEPLGEESFALLGGRKVEGLRGRLPNGRDSSLLDASKGGRDLCRDGRFSFIVVNLGRKNMLNRMSRADALTFFQ